MLTGKEIAEAGIITGFVDGAVQQQGIDVRIDSVATISNIGIVPVQGKTRIPIVNQLEPSYDESGHEQWILLPGYSEISFMEGVDMPNNAALHWKTRSSLVRCGAIIHSGQFDAGFKTSKAGAFLQVICPIIIERGARVAQALVFTSNEVSNAYNGQFQNDIQRK